MKAMILVNPRAGATAAQEPPGAEEVAAACRRAGADALVAITARPGEAIARVARAIAGPTPPEVVVAVGGDGTVREVAEGLARGLGRWPQGANETSDESAPGGAGRGGDRRSGSARGESHSNGSAKASAAIASALLMIPAGSGNSAYRAVWGQRDWHEAIEAAFSKDARRVRALDLIRLVELDRGALLGVNAGLVAAIAARIESDKNCNGNSRPLQGSESDEARYLNAMGRALAEFQPAKLRVAVDGHVCHEGGAMLVTVGGVRSFGRGAFALLPRSVLDDALLDVCVAAQMSNERLGELAALVPAGAHLGEREVAYERGRTVRIEGIQSRESGESESEQSGQLQIEHDGDPLRAPRSLTLQVLPGAVPLIAPLTDLTATEESLWSS
jgi:diacylglycerol kinase (ATP)